MAKHKQLSFQKTRRQHRYCHGGSLRQARAGRGGRPLSRKDPVHLVLKANKDTVKGGFRLHRRFALIHHLLQKYKTKFFIKVEQVSIQGDHIHLLIRITRRSQCLNFFRVLPGQIAQRFGKEGLLTFTVPRSVTDTPTTPAIQQRPRAKTKSLWRFRPFTRVVKGWRPYQMVKAYIQLNEKEALGEIPYRAERIKGLSSSDWEVLWT
jgi:REP element-mobilizing transposase RayT